MPQELLKANEALLAAQYSESTFNAARANTYSEQMVIPVGHPMHGFAQEGSYYAFMEQTPGTPRAYSIQATFSAIVAFLSIKNGHATRKVGLDHIKLLCTTIPASATAARFAMAIDQAVRASAGNTLTPQCVKSNTTNASGTVIRYGAPTIAAAGANVRYIETLPQLRTAILVVGDTFEFWFGRDTTNAPVLNGANPSVFAVGCPPVVLDPGQEFLLHLWFTGNITTASQFEISGGFWEK